MGGFEMLRKFGIFFCFLMFVCNPGVQADILLPDGLIAYYTFSGNADDISGTENDLTVYGATLTSDRFGNANSAYYFDGVDDYMQNVAPNELPTGNEARSVSAWIYSEGATFDNYFQTILNWGTIGVSNAYFGFERGGATDSQYDNKLSVIDWKDNYFGISDIIFKQWYHVVLTFDGNTLNLYIDGQNDGFSQKEYGTINSESGLMIGDAPYHPYDAWHNNFYGLLDDIRIYNRALSAEEVAQIYAYENNPSVVPEPASMLLLGFGLLGASWAARRKR